MTELPVESGDVPHVIVHARPFRRITVVTPVFNEEASLARYAERVRDVLLNQPDYDVRILLVDDGSHDRSWSLIQELCRADPRFRGLRLSRNYGSHVALSAALQHAEGEAVAILACDLQDPPEVVLEFLKRWRGGAQIVWGRRRTRSDESWRVAASRLFETLTRRYALPRGSKFTTGSFLLMDRRVLECYRQFKEHARVTFALVAWTGFEQAVVDYDRQSRQSGRSAWRLSQMLSTASDVFLSCSRAPVNLLAGLGGALLLVGLPLGLIFLLCYVVWGRPQLGVAVLLSAMTNFFGLQFLCMSLLGAYVSRIYTETLQRPLYFVSDDTAEHSKVEGRGP